MTGGERHEHMDTARVHAELSVQNLWLRYVALGGTGDAFELDGYLQGLVTLAVFQQDVLAQALNEALEDSYRAHRVPLSAPPPRVVGDGGLSRLIDDLLDGPPPERGAEPPDTGAGPG